MNLNFGERNADEDGKQPKETLASAVYHQIKREIINGDLAPGLKLKVRQICDRMEVGLSPVREALSRLSTEGFVTQIDRRGFSVAPVNAQGLQDLMLARGWLNEAGLRQSIANGGHDWEERVLLAHHRLIRSPDAPDGADHTVRSPEWSQAHLNFHLALISGSGSQWLSDFCRQMHEAMERYRHVSRVGRTRHSADQEHKDIMEAALARDADRAVALLQQHFNKTTANGLRALGVSAPSDQSVKLPQ